MTNDEDKELLFRDDLHQFLLSVDMIDERLPEAPDLEELWQPIAQSYMPDAIREFNRRISACGVRLDNVRGHGARKVLGCGMDYLL